MKTICLWPQHEANTSHITKTFYIDISTNYIYRGRYMNNTDICFELGTTKSRPGRAAPVISITDVVAAKKEQ